MSNIIIKPTQTCDEYVYWTTFADGPVMAGTRKEMLKYLVKEERHTRTEAEERLQRADKLGSSAFPGYNFGHWDDQSFMYLQQGMLPREKLAEAYRLEMSGRADEIPALLQPFDDDE